jgi:hypothetical protein
MSVKKHYQKRNQELNKDLMKRWGYALPEEPELATEAEVPPEETEKTVNEGLFDSLMNKMTGGDLGTQLARRATMPGANIDTSKYLDDLDYLSNDSTDSDSNEEKADDVINSLEDKRKELEAFGSQVLLLLAAAGISQEDKIYTDIVKSMEDAIEALKSTDAEVKKALPAAAADHPDAWPGQSGQ